MSALRPGHPDARICEPNGLSIPAKRGPCVTLARFTIYVAPSRGRPGHPLTCGETHEGADLRWRLLAANNRDVARSAMGFADVPTCVRAIEQLQRDVATGVLMATRTGRADWSWRWRIGGVDVATSSRTYQRRLQCEAACALFIDLVPEATLVEVRASAQVVPASRRRDGPRIVNPQYGTQRG
jgi:hypothetical protein